MKCCDCEFRNICDDSEIVLTSFCSCKKRNELLSGQKSKADEMFRKLGYLWESTPIEGGRGYEDEDSNKIEVDGYRVTFTPEGGGMALTVGAKTILACAQLIREMEEVKK